MNMETMLDTKAEVHFLTAFTADQADFEGYFLDALGTKERGRSQEVLGYTVKRSVLHHKVVELRGIQVSRNGMFHLLPEALFQPLSLGNGASNLYEIVDEIRRNREREQGNRLFFVPFDTEFFHYSIQLLKRQLGWPGSDGKTARQLVAEIAGQDFGYPEAASMVLLSFFANAERAKDNAPLLSQLLAWLLGREVRISETNAVHGAPPAVALGQARLGVDTVLVGLTDTEGQDWLVEITYADSGELAHAAEGERIQKAVMAILEYFVLATREVFVALKALPQACSAVMGQGILGINTLMIS
jgi:hypothetical protein